MSLLDSKRSGRWALMGLLAAFALLASGCASTVDTRFTVYHAWPADAAPQTYRFERPPALRESLEQDAHELLARAELERAGFKEAPDGRFGVALLFTEERMVRRVADPVGVSPWYGWGGGWPGAWHGWGVGAMFPLGWSSVRDEVWYRRVLRLEIADLRESPPRRVYETTAVAEDFGADPLRVLPVMLRQLLEGFPGPASVQRRARSPLP